MAKSQKRTRAFLYSTLDKRAARGATTGWFAATPKCRASFHASKCVRARSPHYSRLVPKLYWGVGLIPGDIMFLAKNFHKKCVMHADYRLSKTHCNCISNFKTNYSSSQRDRRDSGLGIIKGLL